MLWVQDYCQQTCIFSTIARLATPRSVFQRQYVDGRLWEITQCSGLKVKRVSIACSRLNALHSLRLLHQILPIYTPPLFFGPFTLGWLGLWFRLGFGFGGRCALLRSCISRTFHRWDQGFLGRCLQVPGMEGERLPIYIYIMRNEAKAWRKKTRYWYLIYCLLLDSNLDRGAIKAGRNHFARITRLLRAMSALVISFILVVISLFLSLNLGEL